MIDPSSKLNAILSNISPHSKMNYEELKIVLKYEDYFYETILLPVAKKHNYNISFKDKDIYFDKKGE